MNRSPPSALQLGEVSELQGFRWGPGSLPGQGGRESWCWWELMPTAQHSSPCTTHCPMLWFSIKKQLRCPQPSRLTLQLDDSLVVGLEGLVGSVESDLHICLFCISNSFSCKKKKRWPFYHRRQSAARALPSCQLIILHRPLTAGSNKGLLNILKQHLSAYIRLSLIHNVTALDRSICPGLKIWNKNNLKD